MNTSQEADPGRGFTGRREYLKEIIHFLRPRKTDCKSEGDAEAGRQPGKGQPKIWW